jgi:hypothetical protein
MMPLWTLPLQNLQSACSTPRWCGGLETTVQIDAIAIFAALKPYVGRLHLR